MFCSSLDPFPSATLPVLLLDVLETWITDLESTRFVNVPVDTINKRLTRESSEATSEISSLEKKLHYHETTHKNSRDNLEQILKSGGRA